MDNKDEDFTKQLFFNQMDSFQDTSEKIIEILNQEDYILDVNVLGLIATARALALTYAENDEVCDALLDTSIYMLEEARKKKTKQPSS